MAIVNITINNDADFYRVFQYQTLSGVPIALNGSMEMMLRRRAEDSVALIRLGTDTGEIQIYDPENGLFSVWIKQADLERMALGEFVHSNIWTNTGGFKTSIWSGTFVINAGPTR